MSGTTRSSQGLTGPERPDSHDLLPSLYDELRRLAAHRLAVYPAGTLSATALVHEAFVRIVDADCPAEWNSDRHFFCAFAENIRRVLVENARRKRTVKRGGHLEREDLVESRLASPRRREDLLDLNEALARFEQVDPAAAQLVTLRYFTGLSLREAAEMLGVSLRTANRMWSYAKAWLYRELR